MSLTLSATPLTAVPPAGAPSDQGATKPLLLLGPSLGTSGPRLWAPIVEQLADVAHLVAWDLPGHGASPATTESFTVGDLADAVAALADSWSDETGATARFHAGVSLGGATSLEIGLRHPGAFDGLAVLCSGPKLGTPESWTERAALIRDKGTDAVVDGSRQRWFAPGFVDANPQVAGALLDGLHAVDDESYARCCEALASFDVRERLSEITDPIVAIAGVDDAVAPPEMAEGIAAAAAQGRAVSLDGVAHLAPSEDPVRTAEALRALMTSALPGTPASTQETR